jgi:capsid assembly protease
MAKSHLSFRDDIGRFVDTPLAIMPRVAPDLLRINETISAASMFEFDPHEDGYDVVGGVALLPIFGVLVNGPSYWGEMSYQDIGSNFDDAMDDDDVSAICLQINSPGGEVSGLHDLVDNMYSARGEKPIYAIVDDMACSAAYAIASAADTICLPRTGVVGSIGVIAIHVDISGMLANAGITPTLIYHGDRKADLTPFRPLSDRGKSSLQDDVDEIGELFIETVARNRDLVVGDVRNQEAALYRGKHAIDAGLACEIATPRQAFADLRGLIASPARRLTSRR